MRKRLSLSPLNTGSSTGMRVPLTPGTPNPHPLPPCIRCPEGFPELKDSQQMLACRMVTKVTTKDKREKRVFIVHKNLQIYLVKAGRIRKQIGVGEIAAVYRQVTDEVATPRDLLTMRTASEPSILIEQAPDAANEDHNINHIYDIINKCRQHIGLAPLVIQDFPRQEGLKGLRLLGVFEKGADYTTPDRKVATLKFDEVDARTIPQAALPASRDIDCDPLAEPPHDCRKQLDAVFADPSITVYYVAKVNKLGHGFLLHGRRMIVLTGEALWQLTPDDTLPLRETVNRCVPLEHISELRQNDAYVGIIIPIQYDILLEITGAQDRITFIKALTALNPDVKVSQTSSNLKSQLRLNKKSTHKAWRRPVFASPLKLARGETSPSQLECAASSSASGPWMYHVERDGGSDIVCTPTSVHGGAGGKPIAAARPGLPAAGVAAAHSPRLPAMSSTADEARRIRASAEEFLVTTSSVNTEVEEVVLPEPKLLLAQQPPMVVAAPPVADPEPAGQSASSDPTAPSGDANNASKSSSREEDDVRAGGGGQSESGGDEGDVDAGDEEEESDSFEEDSDWENDFVRDTDLKDSSASEDSNENSSKEEEVERGQEDSSAEDRMPQAAEDSSADEDGSSGAEEEDEELEEEEQEEPRAGAGADGHGMVFDNISPLEQLRMMQQQGEASLPPGGEDVRTPPGAADAAGGGDGLQHGFAWPPPGGVDGADHPPLRVEVTEPSMHAGTPPPPHQAVPHTPHLLMPTNAAGSASIARSSVAGAIDTPGFFSPPTADYAVSAEEAAAIVSGFYASRKKIFVRRLGQVEKLMNAYEGRENVLLRNLQIKYPDYDFFATLNDRVERATPAAMTMGTHSPLFLQNPPNFGGFASPGRSLTGRKRLSNRSRSSADADGGAGRSPEKEREKEAQLEKLYQRFAGLVTKLEDISRSPGASSLPIGDVLGVGGPGSKKDAKQVRSGVQSLPSQQSLSDTEATSVRRTSSNNSSFRRTQPMPFARGAGGDGEAADGGGGPGAAGAKSATQEDSARTERDKTRIVELEFEMQRLRTRIEALTEENNDWAVKHLALQDKTKPKDVVTTAVQCGVDAGSLKMPPAHEGFFGGTTAHSDHVLDASGEGMDVDGKGRPRRHKDSTADGGDRKRISAIRDTVMKLISGKRPPAPAERKTVAGERATVTPMQTPPLARARQDTPAVGGDDRESDTETIAEEPSDDEDTGKEASSKDGDDPKGGSVRQRELVAQWVDLPAALRPSKRDDASSTSSLTTQRRVIKTPSTMSMDKQDSQQFNSVRSDSLSDVAPPVRRGMQWSTVESLRPQAARTPCWSRAP